MQVGEQVGDVVLRDAATVLGMALGVEVGGMHSHWNRCALELIVAASLHLRALDAAASLADVRTLLCRPEVTNEAMLMDLATGSGSVHPAVTALARDFSRKAKAEVDGIVATAATMLCCAGHGGFRRDINAENVRVVAGSAPVDFGVNGS